MERSNQPPKTECCPAEGQVAVDLWFYTAKRRKGSVHRELHGPQAGVAPSLSDSAPKPPNAGGDDVVQSEPNMAQAATGEAWADLPGSESVAREEGADRNLGSPESSRRTNCESQAGRGEQRQEALSGDQGIGLVHSNPRQGNGPELGEGANTSTQPAQATRTARPAGYPWPTFLRAIADKAVRDRNGDNWRSLAVGAGNWDRYWPGIWTCDRLQWRVPERVDVKSPVQENCTPGSERGASGNRRPYLDRINTGRETVTR
jgi:hypothetical protein